MVILIIYSGVRDVSDRAYVLERNTFKLVVGTYFILHHFEEKAFTLSQPYHSVVNHGNGPEEVPLERSNAKLDGLLLVEMLECEENCMSTVVKHDNYELDLEMVSHGLERLAVLPSAAHFTSLLHPQEQF